MKKYKWHGLWLGTSSTGSIGLDYLLLVESGKVQWRPEADESLLLAESPLYSHLALIKQSHSLFLSIIVLCLLLVSFGHIYDKMAILENWTESCFFLNGICVPGFFSSQTFDGVVQARSVGGRIGHGQWAEHGFLWRSSWALSCSSDQPFHFPSVFQTRVNKVNQLTSCIFLSICRLTGRKWMRGCPTKRERKVNWSIYSSASLRHEIFLLDPTVAFLLNEAEKAWAW